ncbi:hypothetical protein Pan44_45260 [Caulifigura coniformis]|uniref:Methylamine utilisation protein MauE domain-containing protein n=1 Tax=Caulifigura coniformis TaxID=2527983 RepID=A0A517SK25_9PLAN|nr:MauE/DoxX family redox-associated membrane protein [Caulifigura coniformis]QDT56472.1 hypothetical protein Pan44_45260 [Caulifigura coniformis]
MSANCQRGGDLRRLSSCYFIAFSVLVGATLPLWTGRGAFPRVPAVSWLTSAGAWLAPLLFGGFLVAAIAFVRLGPVRSVWAMVVAVVLASAMLNQHCFQVWAYHLGVAGLIAAFSAPGRAATRLKWLTIAIYFWSAVSKLDVGFVGGPGQILWGGLLSALRIDPAQFPPRLVGPAPWIMPAGELATALALAIPRTRRIGLWLSIVMHALLLLAVGPLGLGHESGVQIWNVLFIVQNLLLFRGVPWTAEVTGPRDSTPADRSSGDRIVAAMLAGVVVMPAFQPWGYWDVWPSWAVYSARGGWTTILVHHDEVDRLPEEARRYVGEAAPLSDWHPVDVDAWSLAELHCPVYPQPRFRLALAAALSRTARIQVERRSPPDRRTGQSRSETLEVSGGRLSPELEAAFWLNTRPAVTADP